MKKIALFVFNSDPMCFIHVLLNAKDWNDRGHEAKIVVEGTATKLIPELGREENPMHKLWEKAKQAGLIAGACRACSAKIGVLDDVKSQDIELLEGIAGHPSMAQYQEEGFEVITF
ncbi:MAG: DsrE family protein [Deltaproteobacteria bacterium]|nr:DsrE family protein [Deltaproteobacteria bacterium]MBW2218374.1 DsrE family protein [Deltaproteobacteria bacterium]